MALIGALALIGLTVNPAILLVDRMQQRALGKAGCRRRRGARRGARANPAGADDRGDDGRRPVAAGAGDRTRKRDLAAFRHDRDGRAATSTLLTLLVIPVGFVFLHRLDSIFGRLGPWIVIGWARGDDGDHRAAGRHWRDQRPPAGRSSPRCSSRGVLLGVAVLVFRREHLPEPHAEDGSSGGRCAKPDQGLRPSRPHRPRLACAGALSPARCWPAVGTVFDARSARGRTLLPLIVLAAGALYLGVSLQGPLWRNRSTCCSWRGAGGETVPRDPPRARGADEMGRVDPGGPARVPWRS